MKIRFFDKETGLDVEGDFLINRNGDVIGGNETGLFMANNMGWEVVNQEKE